MEYATIQLKVPKEMQVYFTDDYAFSLFCGVPQGLI